MEIIYIHQKNFFYFKYVYLQMLLLKKISRYHGCSNVWNSEDSDAF